MLNQITVRLSIAAGNCQTVPVTVDQGATVADVVRASGLSVNMDNFIFRCSGVTLTADSVVRAGDYISANPAKTDGAA